MTKSELRKIFFEKRNAISDAELTAKSEQIAERFLTSIDLKTVNSLHTFIPIRKFNEIDTSFIYERIWSEYPRIRTVAPRVDLVSGEMENLTITAESEFVENRWGIRESLEVEKVDVAEIGLVLVPLLCFDELGYRVGYGKGFYDKFLAKCRPDCVKVGLSYFPPVKKIDNVGSHDIPLDISITPEQTHRW